MDQLTKRKIKAMGGTDREMTYFIHQPHKCEKWQTIVHILSVPPKGNAYNVQTPLAWRLRVAQSQLIYVSASWGARIDRFCCRAISDIHLFLRSSKWTRPGRRRISTRRGKPSSMPGTRNDRRGRDNRWPMPARVRETSVSFRVV